MANLNLNIRHQPVTDLIASAQQAYNAINTNITVWATGTPISDLNLATTILVMKNNTYAATMQLAREQLTERDDQRKIVEDLLYWATLPAPGLNYSLETLGDRANAITPVLVDILSHSAAIPQGGIND